MSETLRVNSDENDRVLSQYHQYDSPNLVYILHHRMITHFADLQYPKSIIELSVVEALERQYGHNVIAFDIRPIDEFGSLGVYVTFRNFHKQ